MERKKKQLKRWRKLKKDEKADAAEKLLKKEKEREKKLW